MTNSNNNQSELAKNTDFPTVQCWITHRVSYGETDMMNVVYYAEYLHYFERARNELIRNSGLSYKECEARGLFLPVREANCRYRSPARYDDFLQIRVGISEWNKASLKFVYEIYDETKTKLLATGFTQHACVNAESKPIPVPTWLKELFS